MKLLYVVQAYGPDVFGGAESHCRMMATRMAKRGHDVSVLTSCATSYYDWANVYTPGTSEFEGVTIHRLPVKRARDHRRFGPLSNRVLSGHKPVPLFMQKRWLELQGPEFLGLKEWLWDKALECDAVVFFAYNYTSTAHGLPMVSGRVPTVMHPLAHDEPPYFLPVYDTVLKLPTAFAFSVEEDALLARRRFNPSVLQSTIGIGVDLDIRSEAQRFRDAFDVQGPYVVCVGRLDPHKGSDELYDMFKAYKRRNPSDLKLVLVGEPVKPLDASDDIIVTGFVDKPMRESAVAGSLASMHPSYFESFSMVLTEAWSQGKPAIVNAHCDVFNGQARRSGGALPYKGFAELEVALQLVTENAAISDRLGRAGRAYVEKRYAWDRVMDRYETLIRRAPVV